MRAAPAKRRNPGPPLTPAEQTRLDALLEQTDDARRLRALIRDALGIRDSRPSRLHFVPMPMWTAFSRTAFPLPPACSRSIPPRICTKVSR